MKCEVVQFSLEKLKIIYDMNNLTGSDKVNEKLLYQLNERLKIIFTKSGRSKSILDPHALTAALVSYTHLDVYKRQMVYSAGLM